MDESMVTNKAKPWSKHKIHPSPVEEEGRVSPMAPQPAKTIANIAIHEETPALEMTDPNQNQDLSQSLIPSMSHHHHLEAPRLAPVKLEPLPRPRNTVLLPEMEAETKARAARLAEAVAEAAQNAVKEAAQLEAEAEAAEHMVIQRDENAEEM